MIYVINNQRAFNGENPHEKPQEKKTWRKIVDAMNANKDTVILASCGWIDESEIKKRGFHKEDFSETLPFTNRDDRLVASLKEKRQATIEDICFIENDRTTIAVLKRLKANVIAYNGAHDLQEQLSARQLLNFEN